MNHIAVQNINTQYEYRDNNWIVDGKALPEYFNAWTGKTLDFTCTEIVLEVDRTKDLVYWNRIGYMVQEGQRTKVLGAEERVCWVKELDWVFDSITYDSLVNLLREMELLRRLENFPYNTVLDIAGCANLLADLTRDGRKQLQNHLEDYGEILLHLLGSEWVTEPLINLLKHPADREIMLQVYCRAIEVMWKKGCDEVVNVVDVTILERLSDEEDVWQKFGAYISGEFRDYINGEVLQTNLMMGGVSPLRPYQIPPSLKKL
ncbi:MAG: hypothetical protein IJF07_07425 [Lachnospiraceae bacterium]|nr:hypothetical protein [Lachnospiraceae bacterium]